MPCSQQPHRRLRIEPLEDRALLAITPLITDATQLRAIVPTDAQYNDLGLDWIESGFDDSLWLASDSTAPNGVGYDNPPGTPYLPFIDLNVGLAMSGITPTAFVRIPFTVADPSAFNRLVLKLRYDDAFIAYINGTEVARSQTAPAGYPARDTLATGTHDALLQPGNTYAAFDLGSLVGVLQPGANVLAIRGINATLTFTSDDDFLIQATLEGQTPGNAPVAVDDSASYIVGTDPNPVINVLANDTAGSDPIAPGTVRITSPPSNGTATINPNTGAITYVANANFRGNDTLRYTVEDNTSAVGDVRMIIPQNHPVRAHIPTDGSLGTTWTAHDFDDTAWLTGIGSAGFDQTDPISLGGDYTPVLAGGIDLSSMRNVNPSAYVRYSFELTDQELAEVDTLLMRLRWDDGFVAYVNGVEIARAGAPTTPVFNSNATQNRNDATPLTFQTLTTFIGAFNSAAAKSALRAGSNTLAIQVLNLAANNQDLLIQPELTIRSRLLGRVSNEATVTINANTVNPFARDDSAITARSTPVLINVVANDVAGAAPINPASVVISAAPTHGTATVNAQGRILYTPSPGYIGADSLTYTVADNSLDGPVQPGRAYSMISRNATWRYNDSGTDLGTAWRANNYNDTIAGWKGGAGKFGYGDPAATFINCDPAPGTPTTQTCIESPLLNDNYITHYFRTKFTVGAALDLSQLSFMQLDLLRDDGVVIYLNGVEILRENLPAGTVTAATLATTTVDFTDEATHFIRTLLLSSLPAGLLVDGENTIAVELHQSSGTTADAGFDLALALVEGISGPRISNVATVSVNVTIGSPIANNDVALAPQGASIVIPVVANDTAGVATVPINPNTVIITQPPANGTVQVLTGGQVRYTPNPDFFGTDAFHYTVRDQTPPAPPVTRSAVVPGPTGTSWKFLDNGTDQGTAWRSSTFNDATWSSGTGEFGYGDGDEQTVVSFGPNSAMKYITTYFRTTFDIPSRAAVVAGEIFLNYDDGAVIYINGTEVDRAGMALGPVNYLTPAPAAIEDTGVPLSIGTLSAFALSLLVDGSNVIAVEIHQQSATNSDISFDLELRVTEREPAGIVSNPATVTVNVNARPVAGDDSAVVGNTQSVVIPVLANDMDVAQPFGTVGLNPASIVVTQPASGRGTVTVNPDGTVNYQAPIHGPPITVTFTYTVADVMPGASSARSLPATVTIDVKTVPPYTAPDEVTIAESGSISIDVLANDQPGVAGDPIDPTSVVSALAPLNGQIAIDPVTGRITYEPAAGFVGTDMFNYRVRDITGRLSDPGIVTVTVRSLSPSAVDDTVILNQDASIVVPVLANDQLGALQTPLDLTSVAVVVEPLNGSVTVQPDGSLLYAPAPGLSGRDQLRYNVQNIETADLASQRRSNQAIVTFNINTQPFADDDFVTLTTGLSVSIPVLANDTDSANPFPEGNGIDPATLEIVPPDNPDVTVSPQPDGSVTFTISGASRPEQTQFSYSVADVLGARSRVATVTVTLLNDAPLAADDEYFADEDDPLIVPPAFGILANDFDDESDPLVIANWTQPQHGVLALDASGAFTYRPAENYFGDDSFTYTLTDGRLESLPATVTLSVGAISDPPVALGDAFTFRPGMPIVATLIADGANWNYLDDGTDQMTAWRSPAFDDSTWYVGPAPLGYGNGNEATIVDFGDTFNNHHITTYFRRTFEVADPLLVTSVTLDLLRDDGAAVYINGNLAALSNLAQGAGYRDPAALPIGGADETIFQTFDIDPELLVAGSNSIAVEVHQVSATSADLTFDLRLTAIMFPRLSGNVLTNDTDVDQDPLQAVVLDPPAHGSVALHPDGVFYYLPHSGYLGVDTFTYRAFDGARYSDPATVTLTIESPPFTPCTAADLNTDGQITLADLARLVENYGGSPEPLEEGDLDGDGYVGVADLPLLRNLLGQSCLQAPAAVVLLSAPSDPAPVDQRLNATRRDRAADRVFADGRAADAPRSVTLAATRHDAQSVDAALADPAPAPGSRPPRRRSISRATAPREPFAAPPV
jgi:hypothetical protein